MFGLKVTGFYEAGLYAPSHTKMIGLIDPNTKPVETNIQYHVEQFHDISGYSPSHEIPRYHNIENVLNFSKTFTDDDKVLIHCHAGISRSTAIAILVLIQHGMTIENAFDHVYNIRDVMNPNVTILEIGDIILDLDGKLVEYYYDWAKNRDIRYKSFNGQSSTQDMKNILSMFK